MTIERDVLDFPLLAENDQGLDGVVEVGGRHRQGRPRLTHEPGPFEVGDPRFVESDLR